VGLTLAIDLAQRGLDVAVVELRHRGEPPSVKCNHVAARSMEIFRRLGVAAALRRAGLPEEFPNDVVYRTTMVGAELARFPIGCDGGRSEVRRQIGATLAGTAVVQRVQSTYIRAPALLGLQTTPPAWGNFSLNPRRSGNAYAIDGRETWLVHNYLRPDEE